MIPVAGSAYTYAYATVGELVAWIIGWDLILEYALSGATVAVGWSGYFVSFLRDLGLALPPALTAAPAFAAVGPAGRGDGLFNLPAALIVLLVTRAAGGRHQRVGRHQHGARGDQGRWCSSCSSRSARPTCGATT